MTTYYGAAALALLVAGAPSTQHEPPKPKPSLVEEAPDMVVLTGEQAESVMTLIKQQRNTIEALGKHVERLQNGGGCT